MRHSLMDHNVARQTGYQISFATSTLIRNHALNVNMQTLYLRNFAHVNQSLKADLFKKLVSYYTGDCITVVWTHHPIRAFRLKLGRLQLIKQRQCSIPFSILDHCADLYDLLHCRLA